MGGVAASPVNSGGAALRGTRPDRGQYHLHLSAAASRTSAITARTWSAAPVMTCSEFIQRFTDFLDGGGSEEFRREAEVHLESCSECGRYRQVMQYGAELLRSMPQEQISEDFEPRLQHRLYHVDDEVALNAHTASATTVLTVLGMSVLLTALAWSPALLPTAPVVELPPIVVSDPPLSLRPVNALPVGAPLLRRTFRATGSGLWDDAQGLWYEYSPLQQRYRERTPLRRAGLD